MGNSDGGGYKTTYRSTMTAFDKLPPELRQALANATGNWASQQVLARYRRGRTCNVLAWDADLLATREHERKLAVGAYKGNAPDVLYKLQHELARRGARR